VDNASGWTDMHVGDFIDMHNYPGPDSPSPEPHRAAVLGEFGGLGLFEDGHSWPAHRWSYVTFPNEAELAARYTQAIKHVWRLHAMRGLSAAVYTQTSDVETECNGLLTYDRAVTKIAPAILAAANRGAAFVAPAKVILANALFGRSSWKYTTDQPDDAWFQPDFDASSWKEGMGGFGASGTPGIVLNTPWSSGDIWLRRQFTIQAEDVSALVLQVFHDEDAEVYFNGVLAAKLSGFITDYDEFEPSKEALAALRPGVNTIAVHCHQTTGGQGIDVGLIIPQPAKQADAK
jgi:hypothetical protein